MEHLELGKVGEALALKHLTQQNYQLLEKNFRWKHEEIDLIMAVGDELVFVEVKTRSSTIVQSPFQAVSRAKQRHLIRAANAYIQQNNCDLEARFDVVAVVLSGAITQIEHVPNAFYPTL